MESHIRFLEPHLVEKLKEKNFTSLEQLNAETQKIVAALNPRPFQGKTFSRNDSFVKYDRPCLKSLPGGSFTVRDYKTVFCVPDNYHIEHNNHYYSVAYTQCGKPAI